MADIVIASWHWFVLSLILMGIEILAPGAFFLWLGLAALIVAGVSVLHVFTWPIQLILFAVISVVVVWIGRPFYEKLSHQQKNSLNQGAHRFIGTVLVLELPIVNGHSRVTIGGSTWGVVGPDSDVGVKVKVVAIDGNSLVVEVV